MSQMEKITIEGKVVEYEYDGVYAYVPLKRGDEVIMNDYITELHQLGRDWYDTPGSIKNCACKSCNHAREIYGRPLMVWTQKQLKHHGVIKRYGHSASDLESMIEQSLTI